MLLLCGPPYQLGEICQLEKAQRRATKIVPEFRNYSYYKRLSGFYLPSLLYHGRRMDMIMYKIIHRVDGCPFDIFFTFADYQSTRGNSYKLFKQFNHLNVRKYSFLPGFSQRIVNNQNSLSRDVIQSPNVDAFKLNLDNYWIDK